jgi:hypothetical protein
MRKNVFLDLDVLKKAQELLGARTESETIRAALQLVAFRDEAIRSFDRVSGKMPDFRDLWEDV